MSSAKPGPSPLTTITLQVAATARLNHLVCGVRRCRRNCRCIGVTGHHGVPVCVLNMTTAETDEMLGFLDEAAALATPDMLAARLAEAETDDDRAMVEFRRWIFLEYQTQLARAGLAPPLGPPFIEDLVSPGRR